MGRATEGALPRALQGRQTLSPAPARARGPSPPLCPPAALRSAFPGGEAGSAGRREGEVRAAGALTASGETATGPASAASSHLCGRWAPETMSPCTAAPISVPAISMVIPGTEWRQVTGAGGPGGRGLPPGLTPALTVRRGRVPLRRAGGQEHGERRVGHLEELGTPGPGSGQAPQAGTSRLMPPKPRVRGGGPEGWVPQGHLPSPFTHFTVATDQQWGPRGPSPRQRVHRLTVASAWNRQ